MRSSRNYPLRLQVKIRILIAIYCNVTRSQLTHYLLDEWQPGILCVEYDIDEVSSVSSRNALNLGNSSRNVCIRESASNRLPEGCVKDGHVVNYLRRVTVVLPEPDRICRASSCNLIFEGARAQRIQYYELLI